MIYGAYSSPQTFWEGGGQFEAYGINALFLGSGRIDADVIATAQAQGARVYAEFATFRGDYLLEKYPDVAPVGRDGLPIPKTPRFLGACPSCPRLLLEKRAGLIAAGAVQVRVSARQHERISSRLRTTADRRGG